MAQASCYHRTTPRLQLPGWLSSPAILAICCAADVAAAAAPAPAIDWRAPPACGEAETFVAAFRGYLGATPPPPELTIDIHVEPADEDRLRLQLRVRGGAFDGDRELVGADCSALVRAAALAAALAVTSAPPPARGTSPAIAPRPVAAPASASSPRAARRRLHDHTRLLGGYEAGALPGAGPLLLLASELGGARFSAGLGLTWLAGRRLRMRDDAAKGFDASLVSGNARVCLRSRTSATQVGVCAVFEAGAALARGRGTDNDRRTAAPWLAAGVEPMLEFPLAPWLGVVLGATMDVALRRPAFGFDSGQVLFTSAPVSARVWAGPSLHFARRNRRARGTNEGS